MFQSGYLKWAVLGGLSAALAGVALTVSAQNKATPQPPAKAPAAQPAPAQPAPAAAAPPAANSQTANAQPGWVARCASPSRQAPLECVVEQQVVVQATGQQISLVNVRVPGDTRQPVMMVQLPLGLFLPAGLTLQVDEGKAQPMTIQSCDQRACYVGLALNAELLDQMKKGQRLNLGMQSVNREPVTIVHPLADFGAQFTKIQ